MSGSAMSLFLLGYFLRCPDSTFSPVPFPLTPFPQAGERVEMRGQIIHYYPSLAISPKMSVTSLDGTSPPAYGKLTLIQETDFA
jgi:hypothetical protein